MGRAVIVMHVVTIVALATGLAFLLAPTAASVAPTAIPESSAVVSLDAGARAFADSLTEDIILHNLFTPGRSAPSRRYAGPGVAEARDTQNGLDPGPGAGFTPILHGTVVADRPEAGKALLQLDPSDAAPRLYGVGEGAGRYRVMSIEARSVTLSGPRGRVVIRLPQSREENS